MSPLRLEKALTQLLSDAKCTEQDKEIIINIIISNDPLLALFRTITQSPSSPLDELLLPILKNNLSPYRGSYTQSFFQPPPPISISTDTLRKELPLFTIKFENTHFISKIEIGLDFMTILLKDNPLISTPNDPEGNGQFLLQHLVTKCEQEHDKLRGPHASVKIFDNHNPKPEPTLTHRAHFHVDNSINDPHFHILYPTESIQLNDVKNLFDLLDEKLEPTFFEVCTPPYLKWLATQLLASFPKKPTNPLLLNATHFCQAILEGKDTSSIDLTELINNRGILKNDLLRQRLKSLAEQTCHTDDSLDSSDKNRNYSVLR